MTRRAHRNHYVPQGYLKGWADDAKHVWAYRTLVPVPQYPVWERRAVRGIAYRDDLYTAVADGSDSDAFERQLNEEVEAPAAPALARVRRDEPLAPDDWQRLAMYAVALDLRTPASYEDHTRRWNEQLPGIMQGVLEGVKNKLRAGGLKQRQRAPAAATVDPNPLPLLVTIEQHPDARQSAIRAEITIGRALWLHTMRHLLTKTVAALAHHQWSILRPYRDCEWFTSDHPVLRLNYYGEGNHDFGGGWGNPGSEIILPLSPHHLMYTKVGTKVAHDEELSREMTLGFQRLLAQRAHRWIIARLPAQRAVWFRDRVVDQAAYVEEERAWRGWHEAQRMAEDPSKGNDRPD